MFIYDRITKVGTIHDPKGAPDPEFALPSTVNWVRALRILVDHYDFSIHRLRCFYARVGRRTLTARQENTCMEQLLLALHQCSALRALRSVQCKSDTARIAIVSWYYGIYAAASAMVVAQDGSFQNDHTGTANTWDRQIAAHGLIPPPFSMRLSTLADPRRKLELSKFRTAPVFALAGKPPVSVSESHGAAHAYLSGSASWWRWKAEKDIRASRDFRALGVKDFRSKAARNLRDSRLESRSVSFLHQAFRYRGKANYREALFLCYGVATEQRLGGYDDDLSAVLDAFVTASGIFCSRRLGSEVWKSFISDLEAQRAFALSPCLIWGEH